MGKKKSSALETTPDLSFVSSGKLNMLLLKSGSEIERIPVESEEFLEDNRVIKGSNMEQVTFNSNSSFKVTLEFLESMMCMSETAVRETTDWVLC